jgi:hypothetical protein
LEKSWICRRRFKSYFPYYFVLQSHLRSLQSSYFWRNMRDIIRQLGAIYVLFISQGSSLKIASSLQWIEHTPQPYAIKNFYKGTDTATLSSGGVANIGTDTTIDLAANAETQGLKQYATHRNLRLIYVIVEVGYRIVANEAAGITKLSDLKGKRIGTMQASSASYFINKLLSSVGLKNSDYTVVSGNVCMKAPCGSGTFPSMISTKQLDAFGIWEPAVELGAEACTLFLSYEIFCCLGASEPRRAGSILSSMKKVILFVSWFSLGSFLA